jgi:hypothetical protein
MPLAGVLVYVALCALVGYLGRERAAGFSGYFVLSILLTPLVMALVLLVGAQRKPS